MHTFSPTNKESNLSRTDNWYNWKASSPFYSSSSSAFERIYRRFVLSKFFFCAFSCEFIGMFRNHLIEYNEPNPHRHPSGGAFQDLHLFHLSELIGMDNEVTNRKRKKRIETKWPIKNNNFVWIGQMPNAQV